MFDRQNRSVRLTPDGRRLMEAVAVSLSHLSIVTQDIRQRRDSGKITVGMLTSQASLYVIPRMSQFRRHFPEIDINIVSMERNPNPLIDDFDVSIVAGYHPDPGFYSEKVLTEMAYPVCSAEYLTDRPTMNEPADLADATLLHLDEAAFVGYPWQTSVNWASFLSSFGFELPQPKHGLTFSSYMMTVQAALRGLGVAIGWHHIVADFIKEGSLVRPIKIEQTWDRHHYLVVPKNRLERTDVTEFCSWLRTELKGTMELRP
ncbi:LysR substrate-binding domain-containing protein [Pseudohalocynthiibacter sp. F2068]|nr:LysR substrate-binding domain-containing protein [Pseudohalocynthiibacter sp. F2068]